LNAAGIFEFSFIHQPQAGEAAAPSSSLILQEPVVAVGDIELLINVLSNFA
jgi:hypothetical protein